jgi:quercetin dioxygenase-like cupin family protein
MDSCRRFSGDPLRMGWNAKLCQSIGAVDNVMKEKHGKNTVNGCGDSSRVEEEASAEMGMRIKEARKSRGLGIFDIYLRTGIDVDLLSQMEEGKLIPPLGTVVKLAKALDLKMDYFISGKEAKAFTIVRRDARKTTSRYDSKRERHYGYEYESLAPRKTNRYMEPFLVTLKPSETEEERSTHDGQEFIFVLDGKMEMRLGEEIHILEPGDSIYYDSTVPHLVKCHSKEPAKILAVLHTGK